jgi:hypothetical protein
MFAVAGVMGVVFRKIQIRQEKWPNGNGLFQRPSDLGVFLGSPDKYHKKGLPGRHLGRPAKKISCL